MAGQQTVTLVNDFNLGQQLQAFITDGNGALLDVGDLGLLTRFEAESDDKLIEVDAISNNGVPVYKQSPRGFKGRLVWARTGGALEQFYLTQARNFFSGAGLQTLFTLQININNDDGSVDSYLLTGTTFYKFKLGEFTSNKEVEQSMEFMAQQMEVA